MTPPFLPRHRPVPIDKPPPKPSTTVEKLADFLFGCLLVGATPLAVAWLLRFLDQLAFDPVHQRYGERAVSRLQTSAFLIMLLSALASFVLAIVWRIIHRRTPRPLVAFEVVFALFGAFLFLAYWALLIGPNDDWNR